MSRTVTLPAATIVALVALAGGGVAGTWAGNHEPTVSAATVKAQLDSIQATTAVQLSGMTETLRDIKTAAERAADKMVEMDRRMTRLEGRLDGADVQSAAIKEALGELRKSFTEIRQKVDELAKPK